ncbi:MAG: hypothetical protein FWD16_02675 [Clostridia bacterium]|nr:hypothetical protein [Clostridia bacterium]
MKHKHTILLLLVIAVLVIAGCRNSATPNNPTPPPPDAPPKELGQLLTVDYATEEVMDAYITYNEFVEFDEEGYQRLIFISREELTDFKFVEVEYSDDTRAFEVVKELFELQSLRPDKPFVVTWMERGALPHRAITFTDTQGATRRFLISESGNDGKLMLVDFQHVN